MGNTMAGRHHGCPGGVLCNAQSKEETGEKGEAKDHLPKTSQEQNTYDGGDDDDDDDDSYKTIYRLSESSCGRQ